MPNSHFLLSNFGFVLHIYSAYKDFQKYAQKNSEYNTDAVSTAIFKGRRTLGIGEVVGYEEL